MKKAILITLILTTLNSFAFTVNLDNQGSMTIDQLVEIGADSVQCTQEEPRCILWGHRYGIQYQGQSLDEVMLTIDMSTANAAQSLKNLRDQGFCK